MAELTYAVFQRTYQDLLVRPVTTEEKQEAAVALPPPMHVDNYETIDDRCLIGHRFTERVVKRDGFEWINEAPESKRPKWGYVATQPGAQLQVKVNTMAGSGDKNAQVG
jgi:hypothetical protein